MHYRCYVCASLVVEPKYFFLNTDKSAIEKLFCSPECTMIEYERQKEDEQTD